MARNADLSVAERCYSACKLLATIDEKLKSRLLGAKITLLPLGETSPPQYRERLVRINKALENLDGVRRPELTAIAEEIFDLAFTVYRDTITTD
ncbi:MAG TPA: hypothetical protein VHW09_26925 [Bryobacteraceae bacterium]|jgi:hypothetical protein|nr:hypothetical protein [Bryobacteraceae bacterium]